MKSVRAMTGAWDPKRATEGAYGALLAFDDGAFASLAYSGYGHFDSDEFSGGQIPIPARASLGQSNSSPGSILRSGAISE